jgi:hypothetical protein
LSFGCGGDIPFFVKSEWEGRFFVHVEKKNLKVMDEKIGIWARNWISFWTAG